MTIIDPQVELAFWRDVAWDTWQRGHHKLAREIWADAVNAYAALTAASVPVLDDQPAQLKAKRQRTMRRKAARRVA